MEGKEDRFGIAQSSLFGIITTSFTTGSVNAMHDSFTPLGAVPGFIGMMLQCVFGGKGVGFLAALVYGIIAVFVAGLMVGRTPEFLGKKIEKPEIILVSLALLLHPLVILAPTGGRWSRPTAFPRWQTPARTAIPRSSTPLLLRPPTTGRHSRGSKPIRLGTTWRSAFVILIGRYPPIIFMMAVAGSVAAKPTIPVTTGTLRTDTRLFAVFWLGVILVVGALTFLPALMLGPVAEYFAMKAQLLF